MGTSVCSYHIRQTTQAATLEALTHVGSPKAYVSSPENHWVTVVDQNAESFQLQALETTVEKISTLLKTDLIVTAVYDDDVSLYVAFHIGFEVDRFASNGDAFEWLPKRDFPGNPSQLSKAFGWWNGQGQLESVLKGNFSNETGRLKKIVEAFGILQYRATTKMHDLMRPQPLIDTTNIPPDSAIGMLIRNRQSYVEFRA